MAANPAAAPLPGVKEKAGDGKITASFHQVLYLIGRINYTWTNTESLLVHFIAGLAETEKEVATIIYLSLNTTKARIELVERLSKRHNISGDLRSAVLDLTKDLAKVSRQRNELNHSLYSFDEDNGDATTIMMRISTTKTDLKMGRKQQLDAARIEKIAGVVHEIEALNKRAWAILFKFEMPT